jgi:hypothetical protein
MKKLLLKSIICMSSLLAVTRPVFAATLNFDLNALVANGPNSTQTSGGVTVKYEVFTSGTANYAGSISQGDPDQGIPLVPLALTNRDTNDGNAFDADGNAIQNGARPDVVNVQNYTVLTFRWDSTISFVSGFDINDFDYNHSPLDPDTNPGYHDAASVIIERNNGFFINAQADSFGNGLETYNANLITNPDAMENPGNASIPNLGGPFEIFPAFSDGNLETSSSSIPNFLNNVTSLNSYRNNNHTPNTGAVNELPSNPNFTATFKNDLESIVAVHVLYWNETATNSNEFSMGIGFSNSIIVQEEIPESPVSISVWILLGLGGLLLKKT